MRLKDKQDAIFWHRLAEMYRYNNPAIDVCEIDSAIVFIIPIIYPDYSELSSMAKRQVLGRLLATLGQAAKAEEMPPISQWHNRTLEVFSGNSARSAFLVRLARRMRRSPKGRWRWRSPKPLRTKRCLKHQGFCNRCGAPRL